MRKVIIADDEQRICKLITTLVNWKDLGLELIGCANDGMECLELVRKQTPDILITDIRMPELNGLELIRTCIDEGYNIRFIIISGFNQFEYAYTAIKYGVEDFLLKPLSEEELNNTLRRIVDSLDSTQPQALSHGSNHNAMFEAIIRGDITPQEVDQANYALPHSHTAVARVSLTRGDVSRLYALRILEQFTQKLKLYFTPPDVIALSSVYEGELFFLLNFDRAQKPRVERHIKTYFAALQEMITAYPFMQVTLAYVLDAYDIKQSHAKILLTQKLRDSRLLLEGNKVLTSSMLALPTKDMTPYPLGVRSTLFSALKDLSGDKAKLQLQNIMREQMPNITDYPYLLIEHIKQLIDLTLSCLDEIFELGAARDQYRSTALSILACCTSKDEAITKVLSYLSEFVDELKREQQNGDNKVISTAKEYIRAHYAERLELEDVAKTVYLNPVYFGTVFKQEAGMTFTDYITHVRIEAAKTMLRDMQYNISEISARVGYKDSQHFSKVFKKSVGIKPIDYRKLRHRE